MSPLIKDSFTLRSILIFHCMSATSFQYNYPLDRNPYVADQNAAVIYPFQKWGDNATSAEWYVYGRQLPQRSYFGEDMNLSARPITRVIEPTVTEYVSVPTRNNHNNQGCDLLEELNTVYPFRNLRTPLNLQAGQISISPIMTSPVLNSRFAALGAQSSPTSSSSSLLVALLILLAIGGFAGYFFMKK